MKVKNITLCESDHNIITDIKRKVGMNITDIMSVGVRYLRDLDNLKILEIYQNITLENLKNEVR